MSHREQETVPDGETKEAKDVLSCVRSKNYNMLLSAENAYSSRSDRLFCWQPVQIQEKGVTCSYLRVVQTKGAAQFITCRILFTIFEGYQLTGNYSNENERVQET